MVIMLKLFNLTNFRFQRVRFLLQLSKIWLLILRLYLLNLHHKRLLSPSQLFKLSIMFVDFKVLLRTGVIIRPQQPIINKLRLNTLLLVNQTQVRTLLQPMVFFLFPVARLALNHFQRWLLRVFAACRLLQLGEGWREGSSVLDGAADGYATLHRYLVKCTCVCLSH